MIRSSEGSFLPESILKRIARTAFKELYPNGYCKTFEPHGPDWQMATGFSRLIAKEMGYDLTHHEHYAVRLIFEEGKTWPEMAFGKELCLSAS